MWVLRWSHFDVGASGLALNSNHEYMLYSFLWKILLNILWNCIACHTTIDELGLPHLSETAYIYCRSLITLRHRRTAIRRSLIGHWHQTWDHNKAWKSLTLLLASTWCRVNECIACWIRPRKVSLLHSDVTASLWSAYVTVTQWVSRFLRGLAHLNMKLLRVRNRKNEKTTLWMMLIVFDVLPEGGQLTHLGLRLSLFLSLSLSLVASRVVLAPINKRLMAVDSRMPRVTWL